MKKVLYIHGFNSGKGSKYKILSKNFKTFCPTLINEPKKDLKTLIDIIKKENITNVVGTSLGGYYGIILGNMFPDVYFHLINPSIDPEINMRKRLGKTFSNYVDGSEFKVDDTYIKDLKSIKGKNYKVSDKHFYYFSNNDDVIDHNKTINTLLSYKKPVTIYQTEQDHRHKDISLVIQHIKTTI